MELLDLFKLIDGSIAVVAVLFVVREVRVSTDMLLHNQQEIILKLIEMCGDDDEKTAP